MTLGPTAVPLLVPKIHEIEVAVSRGPSLSSTAGIRGHLLDQRIRGPKIRRGEIGEVGGEFIGQEVTSGSLSSYERIGGSQIGFEG